MNSPTPQPALSGVFLNTLAAMNAGIVINDLDDALRSATKAASDAKAKAKVLLEISVVPNGEGAGGTALFKLDAKIKTSLPQEPRQPSVFFSDDDGNLTRRNPKQEEMKLTMQPGGMAEQAPAAAKVSNQ